MIKLKGLLTIAVVLSCCMGRVLAMPDSAPGNEVGQQAEPAGEVEVLRIGTKVSPPFVTKNAAGELDGISVELWKRVAEKTGLQYQWVETDLQTLLNGVQDGRLDASVAALTVTAKREERMDFSHPFYTTGLGIATRAEPGGLWDSLTRIFSIQFLYAVGALGTLLLAVGVLVWAVERRKNPEQFGGTVAEGIGSGFWWAAVTMTTVGYGDKAPASFAGRVIGLVWMFAAILLISGFTAAIATSLTLNSLETPVQGLDDLNRSKVLTVAESSSVEFLDAERIRYSTEASIEKSMNRLLEGKVDAVVFDEPLIRYLANTMGEGEIAVLPGTFKRQDYAIALPTGSDLRESINQAVLEVILADDWPEVVKQYLGE